MRLNVAHQIKKGGRISYNDGRPGHEGVEATVLAVDAQGMTVQFDDWADMGCALQSRLRRHGEAAHVPRRGGGGQ